MKIVQITATMGQVTPTVWGLGSDQKVYYWDYKTCTWRLDKMYE